MTDTQTKDAQSENAQAMMTLASIAYAADTETKDAALADAKLATAGHWTRIWGPVTSTMFDNQMFLVRKGQSGTFALVLRGTVFDSIRSWAEDVPLSMKPFSDFVPEADGAYLANGFYDALDDLKDMKDQGRTVPDFLEDQGATEVFVTGHSQGGALCPIFLGWLQSRLDGVVLQGFAFAQPTPGDQTFAAWIARTTTCFLYNNPHDLVPLAYDRLGTPPEETPVPLRDEIAQALDKALIRTAGDLAENLPGRDVPGAVWAAAGDLQPMREQLDPADAALSYEQQILDQHNHNSYLVLLGAAQCLGIGDKACDIGTRSHLT